MDEDFLYEKETYQIIGTMMEVHKTLGCGFLEAVYQEALSIEFEKQNIPFVKEKKLILFIKEFKSKNFILLILYASTK